MTTNSSETLPHFAAVDNMQVQENQRKNSDLTGFVQTDSPRRTETEANVEKRAGPILIESNDDQPNIQELVPTQQQSRESIVQAG